MIRWIVVVPLKLKPFSRNLEHVFFIGEYVSVMKCRTSYIALSSLKQQILCSVYLKITL